MDRYSRVVSVSGRNYRVSATMCDIFLAHASDIASRGAAELVPLLHEGGVEMLLIGATSRITVSGASSTEAPAPVTPLVDHAESTASGIAASSAA